VFHGGVSPNSDSCICGRVLHDGKDNISSFTRLVQVHRWSKSSPTSKRLQQTMGWKSKRSARNNRNQITPIGSYTVTVMAGKNYIECDTCCMPSDTVYEFPDGSVSCDLCVNGMSSTDFLLTGILLQGGMYGYGGDYS
jgi:hypothetical protein